LQAFLREHYCISVPSCPESRWGNGVPPTKYFAEQHSPFTTPLLITILCNQHDWHQNVQQTTVCDRKASPYLLWTFPHLRKTKMPTITTGSHICQCSQLQRVSFWCNKFLSFYALTKQATHQYTHQYTLNNLYLWRKQVWQPVYSNTCHGRVITVWQHDLINRTWCLS